MLNLFESPDIEGDDDSKINYKRHRLRMPWML